MGSDSKLAPNSRSSSDVPQLKIVVLDFPKKMLENEEVKKILSDSVVARQLGFQRTIETYITADKHDMISTHLLVYDVSSLYRPRILTGIRIAHEDRCRAYGLKLPLDENIQMASAETQEYYKDFKARKGDVSECIGWFVDADFSYAKTKIDLAQILMFTMVTFLLRRNLTYCSGATNERYKASRWVEKLGHFEDGHVFNHPTIPYPHKVTLIEHFHYDWLHECFERYGDLIYSSYQLLPNDESYLPLKEVEELVRSKSKVRKILKAS